MFKRKFVVMVFIGSFFLTQNMQATFHELDEQTLSEVVQNSFESMSLEDQQKLIDFVESVKDLDVVNQKSHLDGLQWGLILGGSAYGCLCLLVGVGCIYLAIKLNQRAEERGFLEVDNLGECDV